MKSKIIDGSQAVGQIAYKLSQVVPIYPITPSSPIAEYCSSLNAKGERNLFNQEVKMIEMQSEGGVAGVLHGALSSHALSSTFTSSQGLLLMLPNMFKIAGECLPAVMHVAARAVASHALSIFCDHSDIMAVRSSGFIFLGSCSVEEANHIALASHLLALKCSLPVLHFFDGFRTSHEIQKVRVFEDEEIKMLLGNYADKFLNGYTDKQMGTAQNPDVFFQNRERNSENYFSIEKNLNEIFNSINKIAGTNYKAYEYFGKENAENVIVAMGSSCKTIEEYISTHPDCNLGLITVRLYRPFLEEQFVNSIPKNVKNITVLDRTKENGAKPPLYLDVVSALQGKNISILSGRYGLGGKEFDPSCVQAVLQNMICKNQKNNFTVGIDDDMFGSSLDLKECKIDNKNFNIKMFGLGSDGSVSAGKSTIKILGENYDKYVQGYFEYDSKKSGSLTICHLRLSDDPIKSEYLVNEEDVISINNFSFVTRYDCLSGLKENGLVILNTIFDKNEIGRILPKNFVEKLKQTHSRLFVIDGQKIARENSLGSKINIIMQTALFKCASLLSDSDIEKFIPKSISTSFAVKGQDVVDKNIAAMKMALTSSQEVDVNSLEGKIYNEIPNIDDKFFNDIMLPMRKLEGNKIKVSKFESDGSAPLETSKFEKRGISSRLPQWIKENCIQCGRCSLVCPNAALRAVNTHEENLKNAPDTFET